LDVSKGTSICLVGALRFRRPSILVVRVDERTILSNKENKKVSISNHVLGIDHGPFEKGQSGPVPIVGAMMEGVRMRIMGVMASVSNDRSPRNPSG
jgi:hypothetical protein